MPRQPANISKRPWLLSLIWPARPEPAKSWKIARGRLAFAAFFACLCFGGIGAQALQLAVFSENAKSYQKPQSIAERGLIVDRRGRLLASTLPVMVLHADPKQLLNPRRVANSLAPLISDKSADDIYKLLGKNTRYVELDRKITPRRHAEILQLGLPGVFVSPSSTRLYPQGQEAAHLLGAVDVDGKGIAGIEAGMNDVLMRGETVQLSIDLGLQAILRREINSQIERFEAIAGAGLILDMKNGEILAMASLPDFDPNHLMRSTDKARFNQAAKGVFEMGSIFKILNTAIALETGAVQIKDRIDVAKPIRISRFAIRDYHPFKRALNISEILVHSSNIGSAHMADKIGPQTQRAFMDKLQLLQPSNLEIPENARPLVPQNWGRIASLTISFGHGLSVSPVQAAAAISAAAGDGFYVEPTLIKRSTDEPLTRSRIFSPETARAVRSMMRLVVAHPSGTGNFAEAKGYLVGGKTGTAEKIKAKGYDRKANRVSFVGTFPAHDPRYLIFAMVDEPKGQKFSYGYATAGWVTAPIVKKVVEQAAPLLGVHPIAEMSPEMRLNLLPEVIIDGEEAVYASF